VLREVSFEVEDGECLALLGPSGCGKTTTLRAIAGFVQPSAGDIRLAGRSLLGLPPHRRNLGLVFQDYALFPHMTVAQNVGYGLRMRGASHSTIAQEVARVLDLVRLTGLADRVPDEMSGGQRQRVALARALVVKPDVLLLDEPLAALDRKLREGMQVELKRIQRETGITTIIVTHDQEEALSLADRVAVMLDGGIAEIGAPSALYQRPRSRAVMDFLGASNLFSGRAIDPDHVDCGQGLVLAVRDLGVPVGSPVLLGIRPEHACLASGPGANHYAGTVAEVVYRGASTDVYVEAAGVIRTVTVRGESAETLRVPAVGAAVWVLFPRDALVRLE
jgi:ABC-type Fe3+/spermidine/putrescine transport system ATPase subunit